jgi:hypothetical protein
LEGEQLLLIDVVNAHGAVILQTIWGTTADARFGQPRALTSSDLGGKRPFRASSRTRAGDAAK